MELQGQILVFTENGCEECINAKTKLDSLFLPYVEVDLTINPGKRSEMVTLTDQESVPQIFFNDNHIGSYQDLIGLETNNQLDSLIELVKVTPVPKNAPKPTGRDTSDCRVTLENILIKMDAQGLLLPHRQYFTVHHSSFHGKDLVSWLKNEEGMTQEAALSTGEDMVKQGLITHVTDTQHPFVNSPQLFKVVGAGYPSALNAGITTGGGEVSAVEIGEDLRKYMTSLAGRHITEEGYKVDYDGIKDDDEFVKYVETAQALQRVSLEGLSRDELVAMFVNVYNALIIHGIVIRGAPTNHFIRYKFFNNVSYVIAGHNYSLNDIENGVLRANRKGMTDLSNPFSAKDPRLEVALKTPEPRVHFALNCASKGCPPIRFYSAAKLDAQLNLATKAFLTAGGCIIDKETHQVSLSPILKWYKADFGRSDSEVLTWILGFISHTDEGQVLEELIDKKQYKISWQGYDWSLNH